jgi:DNA-binding transcriptional MerR regulator
MSNVVDKFSRREVMELAGATSNQLQYLERSELITPERVWNGKKKPDVYYSWEQMLEIKAIRNLRETTSLQTIRKILSFFEEYQFRKTLKDKRIVAIDDEVFWIKEDWSDFGKKLIALKIADKHGKGIGQYTLLALPAFQEIVDEIWETAEKSVVIDIESFRQRAKARPSGAA